MKKLFIAVLVFSGLGAGYFAVKQYEGSAWVAGGADRDMPTKGQGQEFVSTPNNRSTNATDQRLEAGAGAIPNGVVIRLPDHKPVEIVPEERNKIDKNARQQIADQSAESQRTIESLAQEYNENLSNEMPEASKAYKDAAIKIVKAGT